MMETQSLGFSYGKTSLLKDISVKFEKGKLYAVIGPNGSGKTTLINLLSRLIQPQSGNILLDGESYEQIGRKSFAKKVALLPQSRNVPNMTAYDLVACGRFPHLDWSRKMTAGDENVVRSALKVTDTEKFYHKSLKKLSGGELQRVYLAMLHAQNTPYVLLDEPTTHLDISAKHEIMKLLCDMKQDGKCVVAVLHDLELALQFADEVILMSAGKIVSAGTPDETVESGKIQTVFGVKCKRIIQDGAQFFSFGV